ncbi:hypothetical protein AZ78_3320 [Lysobacter capsici AZ78]|uniref:Uncharacterized protein n=1 Tax=Lysobacter capsici AZ78 TaxID=1444315 RepID=A0A125MN84_9GAMM|nr:hypothetical protein AZ78_3320 [Lysobacter capsici AZ78]
MGWPGCAEGAVALGCGVGQTSTARARCGRGGSRQITAECCCFYCCCCRCCRSPLWKRGAGGFAFRSDHRANPQKRIPRAPIICPQRISTGARPLLQSGRRLSPATARCRPACIAFACIVFASIDPACIAILSHRLLLFPPLEKGGWGDSLFDPIATPTAKANPPRTDHFRATNPHRRSPPFTKWAPTFAGDSTVSTCMHRLCIHRACMHRHPKPSAFAVPPFGKGGLGGFAFRSGRHANRKSESPAHRSLPRDQPTPAFAPFYKVGADFRTRHRQGAGLASIDLSPIDPASITIGSLGFAVPPFGKGGWGIRFSIRSPRQPQKRIPRAPITSARPPRTGARPLLQSGHRLSRSTSAGCRPFIDRPCIDRPCMHRHPKP